jgi:hypothetical protein
LTQRPVAFLDLTGRSVPFISQSVDVPLWKSRRRATDCCQRSLAAVMASGSTDGASALPLTPRAKRWKRSRWAASSAANRASSWASVSLSSATLASRWIAAVHCCGRPRCFRLNACCSPAVAHMDRLAPDHRRLAQTSGVRSVDRLATAPSRHRVPPYCPSCPGHRMLAPSDRQSPYQK